LFLLIPVEDKMLYKLINSIVIFLVFLILACSEKEGPIDMNDITFSVIPYTIPARINISYDKEYSISFKVTHPQGFDAITKATAKFRDSDSQVFFELLLFDDGSTINPSGKDVVAKDGIFSNTFDSDSTIFFEGTITIHAEVLSTSSEIISSQPSEAQVSFNEAPKLVSVSNPDTLFSGSEPVIISAIVLDLDGIEDIGTVTFTGRQQQINIFEEALEFQFQLAPDSGQFSAFFDSTFAAGKKGLYDLDFQAKDLSGETSNTISKSIYLENFPPKLSNVVLPDSVQRPQSGQDTIAVNVSAKDPQGINDIEIVAFDIFRTGGDTTTIEMFDDGDFINHRDEIANDGIYSRGLTVSLQSVAAKFYFVFQAKDKANNFSVATIDSMILQ